MYMMAATGITNDHRLLDILLTRLCEPTLPANDMGVSSRLRAYLPRWASCPYSALIRSLNFENFAPAVNADFIVAGDAFPVPAMSKAVPWSTDVRRMGRPTVTETVSSKSNVFVAMWPWSW